MTDAQLEARKERAENGTLVVLKVGDGFRVYSVQNPSRIYLVRQEGERWVCNCPDFEYHKADTTWRCKHILAVAPWPKRETAEVPQSGNGSSAEPPTPIQPNSPAAPPSERGRTGENGGAQMLIKRSVSPDGRIDSVSVEFSMSVAEAASGEIKAKAANTLRLQKEIVADFLKMQDEKAVTPPPPASKPPDPARQNGQPVFARLVDVGKMKGKWGDRFYLNVAVNGRTLRLFGSPKQLAEHIQSVGYEIDPQHIEPGLQLNLACRAVTKPSNDGRYTNVDKVLPLARGTATGGGDGRDIPY
jgi:SWIM zinc finger